MSYSKNCSARDLDHIDTGRARRSLRDLPVISCLIDPKLGTEIKVKAPPENGAREIFVYSKIDGRKIKEDSFDAIAKYFRTDP